MSVAEIIGLAMLILGGMAGLIKTMVLGRLDKIDAKIDAQDEWISGVDGRVIRLEEWRKGAEHAATFGRRAMDHCPSADCPFERTNPGTDR